MSNTETQEWDLEFSPNERALLKEVALSVKRIQYGSVVMTIHEGRLIEVSKTERIR